ncbi:MAG: APC family permease [Bacteroidia bacterium]|nr:APC family permease [Bacteroidia bacterium]
MNQTDKAHLDRKLGLFQSTVINMIDMVGIGPFVVLPLVITMIGGPLFLWAWVAGAVLSFIDAMIWSELGAAYPRAGGSFHFLREAYGNKKWGRMFSFLYVWQTLIQAPLVVASGAIGFSQYAGYLFPLDEISHKIVSGAVVISLTLLLYRKIETIGRISVLLWAGVIGTLGWIVWGGVSHGNMQVPVQGMLEGAELSLVLSAGFGAAMIKTIYSYLGYYNVCHLGGEIRNPGKNIPRSMFLSVAGIAILYLLLNISVTSVIPWQEAMHSEFIVSTFIEKLYGSTAANWATLMVLWVAFASLFAVMLGYSRIPYAAATEGEFFRVFSKLHPTKHFPHVSLLGLGLTAFIFSLLFKLSEVITAILAMRILIQFVGQAIGVVLLRRRKGSRGLPYKMPLYPLPVILAVGIWFWVFYATGLSFMLAGLTVIGAGLLAFLIKARSEKHWPVTDKTTA